MARRIRIAVGGLEALAELNDSKTADAVWDALPINASASTWGDEIYFGIPVSMGEDNGKEVVELGDIAYWPPGNAFCIFYGLTPASTGSEIRPASAVNVFGKIEGDPTLFKPVRSGALIRIEKV